MEIGREYISFDEAMEITGFTEKHLKRKMRENGVPRIGRGRYYFRDQFEEFYRNRPVGKQRQIMPMQIVKKPINIKENSASEFVKNLLKKGESKG